MRYKKIVEQVISDINSGKLARGSRMPSLRQMAALQHVSLTTVQNAFHQLEELGWLLAKPQAGFYVSAPLINVSIPSLPQFSSRPVTLEEKTSRNASEIPPGPLGTSQLSPDLVPYEAFKRSMRRAIKNLRTDFHFYPEPSGSKQLKDAVSAQFFKYGFPFHSDDLVITNGCIDAVRFALETTTKPGDSIAISSPCFNGIIDLLSALGRKVIEIPCLPDGIDLDQFERHAKNGTVQAGLFSTSHMNPQGISLTAKQKQRLAQIANQLKIPVIEDDVYIELGHAKTPPLPAKYWDEGGYILWCGSISKTLSAALRIGWCIPGQYKAKYIYASTIARLGVNMPIQAAVADFISSGQYNKHISAIRLCLKQQLMDYRAFVVDKFPAKTAVSAPEGGMVLWLQFPNLCTKKFEVQLMNAEIDIRLGASFSTLPLYKDCVRINCGWPLSDDIKSQLIELARIVNESIH